MSHSTIKPTKWHAPRKDSDQPGHPPRLIRVFVVCSIGCEGLMQIAKTLIKLGWHPGWPESLFCWFCHAATHLQTSFKTQNNFMFSILKSYNQVNVDRLSFFWLSLCCSSIIFLHEETQIRYGYQVRECWIKVTRASARSHFLMYKNNLSLWQWSKAKSMDHEI